MMRFVSLAVVLCFVVGPAMLMAQDAPKAGHTEHKDRAAGEKRVEAPLQDLALTGKIVKEEKKGEDGKPWVHYTLTTADGTLVMLPRPKGEAPAAIKLDDYLNVDVKVVAKGREMERQGKKVIRVVEIVSIEKAAEAPAAKVEAPAAKVEAPAAK